MDDSHGSVLVLYANDFLLRPWTVDDATWYIVSRDEEVFKWTTEKRDLTVAEVEESIGQVNDNPDMVSFAIVEKEGTEILGNIALVVADNRSAEIMYWLAPWGRGRGIATNAVKLLCRWAFETLSLERITLQTYPDNVRSQWVAKRAGFQLWDSKNDDKAHRDQVWFELYDRQ